jgi:hypothetical protein
MDFPSAAKLWGQNHDAGDLKSVDSVTDRLCGLVVRVPDERSTSPGLDSRRYQIS